MTTTILSGIYTAGITLTATDTTITRTGSVYSSTTNAVGGPSGTAWTLSNYGSINSTGTNSDGVSLASGGMVTNAASATIQGQTGIGIVSGAGTVSNYGSIVGTGSQGAGIVLVSGGSVTNGVSGYIYAEYGVDATQSTSVVNSGMIVSDPVNAASTGIVLAAGGSVTNLGSGVIYGYTGIFGAGSPVAVVNDGAIEAVGAGSGGSGVDLQAGGTVSNSATGLIYGYDGVANFGASTTATVFNEGLIIGTGATSASAGVYLAGGGLVSNASTGIVTGYSGIFSQSGPTATTIINDGTVIGTGTDIPASGVVLLAGGYVTNSADGTIIGYSGVSSYNDSPDVTVVNAGSLIGTGLSFGAAVYLNGGSVTNTAGGVIAGYASGIYLRAPGFVFNNGLIETAFSGSAAVQLADAGTVVNAGSGVIYGYNGVTIGAGAGTVLNDGIIDAARYAVVLRAGGYIGNGGSGDLVASYGVLLSGGSGTLINAGSIVGGGFDVGPGVWLKAGGYVSNASSGVILNADGVYAEGSPATVVNSGQITGDYPGNGVGVLLAAGGSVVASGTITGDGGTSVAFGYNGSGDNLLIINPGAVFQGSVVAQGTSVLELASAAATGTLTGLGSNYYGFGLVVADQRSNWIVEDSVIGIGTIEISAGSGIAFYGSVVPSWMPTFAAATGTLGLGDPDGFGATIYGFQRGDTFDFTTITSAGSIHAGIISGNDLTLSSDGVLLAQITLAPSPSLASATFVTASDGRDGTFVTEGPPICFLPGTMIQTLTGETEVERLRVGDEVRTANGDVRPIIWIGRGQVLATRGKRGAATPVIIRKGALADNVPHHDLRVSKAHALFLDDVLIPVEFLVNHRSVLWDDRAQEVTLFHIELETHDVLMANGAPAESYRDDGNRWLFQNQSESWALPPARPCAPVVTGGAVVDTVWQRLMGRAGPRPGLVLTDDPDLHLVVDDMRIDPVSSGGGFHVFRLSRKAARVRVVSRTGTPAELGLSRDPRCLGVALRRILIRQGTRRQEVALSDDRLIAGFHALEADNGWRWTDGDAALPESLFTGFEGVLELVLQCAATRYVDDGRPQRVA